MRIAKRPTAKQLASVALSGGRNAALQGGSWAHRDSIAHICFGS